MAVEPSVVDVASAALVTPTDTFITGPLAAAIAARQLKTPATEALAPLTIGEDILTFLQATSYSAARALLDGKSRKSNIIGSSTTLANTTHSGAVNRTTVSGIVLTIDPESSMDYWCESFFIAQGAGSIEFQVNGGVTLNGGTTPVALATDALGLLLRTGSTDYWLFQISTALGGGSVWGSITGTLANQTDLNAALAAKADVAGDTFTGPVTLFATEFPAGVPLASETALDCDAGDYFVKTFTADRTIVVSNAPPGVFSRSLLAISDTATPRTLTFTGYTVVPAGSSIVAPASTSGAKEVIIGRDAAGSLYVTMQASIDDVYIPDGAIAQSKVAGLTADLAAKAPVRADAEETGTTRANTAADATTWVRWTSTSAKTFTINGNVAAATDEWVGTNVGASNLTIAPGTSMTLIGNAVFAPGESYRIWFSSATTAIIVGGAAA